MIFIVENGLIYFVILMADYQLFCLFCWFIVIHCGWLVGRTQRFSLLTKSLINLQDFDVSQRFYFTALTRLCFSVALYMYILAL